MSERKQALTQGGGTALDGRSPSPAAGWLICGLLLLGTIPSIISPNEFVKDDSYFYLQIAANIVDGRGSTFHGVTLTNGYHPLWMSGAVTAMWLAGGDRIAALTIVAALQALLLAGIALLFLRLTRAMQTGLATPGMVVLLGYFVGTGLLGSEAYLNALTLLAGLLLLWTAMERFTPWRWFAAGVVLGLCLLARLDNVFVVVSTCAIALVGTTSRDPRAILFATLSIGLGGLLVVAPYLAWNLAEFGHIAPVSGAIKSTFPSFNLDPSRLGAMGQIAAAFGLASVSIGLFLDNEPRRKLIWLGLGSGVVAHAVYVAGFTDHYTFWPWYYVAGVITGALSTSYLATRAVGILSARVRHGNLVALVAAVSILVFSLLVARAWFKAFNPIQVGSLTIDLPVNEYRWAEEFGQWLSRNMRPEDRVFAYDWPGAIAYYSGLQVIPMDGLVNDFAYNDELVSEGAHEYLCSRGIHYYFGLLDSESIEQRVPVLAPLTRLKAGELRLAPEQIVVTVRDVVSRPAEALPFALWRLDCDSRWDRT